MNTHLRAAGALALWAAASGAGAGPVHDHGAARLDVALDGAVLTIALEMPLDSLVGFERAPRTPAERQAATAALARLRDGAALFKPDLAAQCTLQAAEVSAPVLESPGAAASGGHADLDAEYRFQCAQPTRLGAIEVRLFETFRRLERLDVQAALPAGQRKARLSRSQSTLRLTP